MGSHFSLVSCKTLTDPNVVHSYKIFTLLFILTCVSNYFFKSSLSALKLNKFRVEVSRRKIRVIFFTSGQKIWSRNGRRKRYLCAMPAPLVCQFKLCLCVLSYKTSISFLKHSACQRLVFYWCTLDTSAPLWTTLQGMIHFCSKIIQIHLDPSKIRLTVAQNYRSLSFYGQ